MCVCVYIRQETKVHVFKCAAQHAPCFASPTVENKFKKKLQDQQTFERQPATFEVELVDPDAPLTWFIKGEEVKPSDNIEIVKNGAVHKLIIKEAAMDHEGEIKVCKLLALW